MARCKLLRNDIWRIMHKKALVSIKESDITIVFKHVPTHVGIYDNERVDRLSKTSMERTHKVVPRTAQEHQDNILERMTDDIVFACCRANS